MPEISEARYQELLASEWKAQTLEHENKKLIETAENTKTWLKANREEIARLKQEKEDLLKAKETFENEATEKLKALEWIDELKAKAEKFEALENEKIEARKTSIEEMKTKLWEEFLKNNASFLEWLSDDKVEIYLKQNVENLSSWNRNIATWTWGNQWAGWAQHQTDFDKSISSWDWMWALWQIPVHTWNTDWK